MNTYEAIQAEITSLEQQQKVICNKLAMLKDNLKPALIWSDRIEDNEKHDKIGGFNFDKAKIILQALYTGKKLLLHHTSHGDYTIYTVHNNLTIHIQAVAQEQYYMKLDCVVLNMLIGGNSWYILPDKQD